MLRNQPVSLFGALRIIRRNCKRIKIYNYVHIDMPVEMFIKHFITIYSRSYGTIYAEPDGKPSSFQCAPLKRRSLGDIYLVTKFYYPKVKLLEVRDILTKLAKDKVIYSGICLDIFKRTYFGSTNAPDLHNISSINTRDEFGWLFDQPINK